MSSPGDEVPFETGIVPSIWLSDISNQNRLDNRPIEAGIIPENLFKFRELYGKKYKWILVGLEVQAERKKKILFIIKTEQFFKMDYISYLFFYLIITQIQFLVFLRYLSNY